MPYCDQVLLARLHHCASLQHCLPQAIVLMRSQMRRKVSFRMLDEASEILWPEWTMSLWRDGDTPNKSPHPSAMQVDISFVPLRFMYHCAFLQSSQGGKNSEQPVDVHVWGPGRQRRHRGGCSLSGGGVSLTAALKLFLHQVFELWLRAHIAGLQPADYSHSPTLCLFVFTLSALSEPERAGLFYNRPSCRINLCHGDSPRATASTHCLWQRTERPHGLEGRTGQLPHCGAFSVTWKYRLCVSVTWCATYSAFGVHSLTQSLTQSSTLVGTHAAFTFTSGALWHTNTRQCWKGLRGLSYSQLRMGQFRCVLGCSGKRRSNLSIRLGENSQRMFQAQSQS